MNIKKLLLISTLILPTTAAEKENKNMFDLNISKDDFFLFDTLKSIKYNLMDAENSIRKEIDQLNIRYKKSPEKNKDKHEMLLQELMSIAEKVNTLRNLASD